jgi:hypothetical protein
VIGLADRTGVVEHGVGGAGDAAAVELVERAPRAPANLAVGPEAMAALDQAFARESDRGSRDLELGGRCEIPVRKRASARARGDRRLAETRDRVQ